MTNKTTRTIEDSLNSMQFEGDVSYLGQMQTPVGEKFETNTIQSPILDLGGLAICDGINLTLKSRKSFLFTRFVFDSAKEVFKGFMYLISQTIKDLGRKSIMLFRKIFRIVKFTVSLTKFINIFSQNKQFIINLFRGLERFNQSLLMFIRRIDTILIHTHSHSIKEDVFIYKDFYKNGGKIYGFI